MKKAAIYFIYVFLMCFILAVMIPPKTYAYVCGENCSQNPSGCNAGLSCIGNVCRNSSCSTSTDCNCYDIKGRVTYCVNGAGIGVSGVWLYNDTNGRTNSYVNTDANGYFTFTQKAGLGDAYAVRGPLTPPTGYANPINPAYEMQTRGGATDCYQNCNFCYNCSPPAPPSNLSCSSNGTTTSCSWTPAGTPNRYVIEFKAPGGQIICSDHVVSGSATSFSFPPATATYISNNGTQWGGDCGRTLASWGYGYGNYTVTISAATALQSCFSSSATTTIPMNAPTCNSFSNMYINGCNNSTNFSNNDISCQTTTPNVTLHISSSAPTMRFYEPSSYAPACNTYAASSFGSGEAVSSTKSWTLNSALGDKKVCIRLEDALGGTQCGGSIHLVAPTPTNTPIPTNTPTPTPTSPPVNPNLYCNILGFNPNSPQKSNTNININWNVYANFGIQTGELLVDGILIDDTCVDWNNCNSSWTPANSGNRAVSCRVTDQNGNVNTSANSMYCIDGLAPDQPASGTLSCSYDNATGKYAVSYSGPAVVAGDENGCAGFDTTSPSWGTYWQQLSTDSGFSTAINDINGWQQGLSTQTTAANYVTAGTTVYAHRRTRDRVNNQSSWSSNISILVNNTNCVGTPTNTPSPTPPGPTFTPTPTPPGPTFTPTPTPTGCISGGTINGHVFNDVNNNGVYNAPAENLTASGWAGLIGTVTAPGISTDIYPGANGWYTTANLSPGTYNVSFSPVAGYSATNSTNRSIVVCNSNKVADFGVIEVTPTPTNTPTPTSTPTPTPYPTAVITGAISENGGSCPSPRLLSTSNAISLYLDPTYPDNISTSCTLHDKDGKNNYDYYDCTVSVNNQVGPLTPTPVASQDYVLRASGHSNDFENPYFCDTGTCPTPGPGSSTLPINVAAAPVPIKKDVLFMLKDSWFKLKDTAFSAISVVNNFIPGTVAQYAPADADDTGDRLMVRSDAGVVTGSTIDTGSAPVSSNNWRASSYSLNPISRSLLSGGYAEYVKARKSYTNISNPANIASAIANGGSGIYILGGSGITVNLTAADFSDKDVVLVMNDVKVTFGGSDFKPTGNVAIIINDTGGNGIYFDNMTEAKGIFIGNNIYLGATTDQGLKVNGNIISTKEITNNRKWSQLSRPSLFVVNRPDIYMALLPYLSIDTYDWRQLK